MSIHPLKLTSIVSLVSLLLTQLSLLLWVDGQSGMIMGALLAAPLLIPLKGIISGRRYTFKWIGFLTMLYLAIGISESFSNPELRVYGVLTITFRCLLFFSSIYYSRVLR